MKRFDLCLFNINSYSQPSTWRRNRWSTNTAQSISSFELSFFRASEPAVLSLFSKFRYHKFARRLQRLTGLWCRFRGEEWVTCKIHLSQYSLFSAEDCPHWIYMNISLSCTVNLMNTEGDGHISQRDLDVSFFLHIYAWTACLTSW